MLLAHGYRTMPGSPTSATDKTPMQLGIFTRTDTKMNEREIRYTTGSITWHVNSCHCSGEECVINATACATRMFTLARAETGRGRRHPLAVSHLFLTLRGRDVHADEENETTPERCDVTGNVSAA